MTTGRRVVYFGLFDPEEVPGVHRKMLGLLGAARAQGFEARSWVEPFSRDALMHRLVAAIDAAPEQHIILRSLGWANMFV